MNKKKPKIKIFVVHHKPTPALNTEIFTPIQVGKISSPIRLDMIGDDTGYNISEKNSHYCELTAQYWAWKNIDADYIGFFHYRRFFNFNEDDDDKQVFIDFSKSTRKRFKWFDEDVTELCSKYDIILPTKALDHPAGQSKNNMSLYDCYATDHIENDLKTTISVIKIKYPDFSELVDSVIARKQACFANTFIMKKEYFDGYMSWLFDILFEVEKKIIISDDPYQSRVFGFLAERLLNVYVEYLKTSKNLKIKELKSPYGAFEPKEKFKEIRRRIFNLRTKKNCLQIYLLNKKFQLNW